MITCSVCKTQNDEYAITCGNCKSYIQNRIPNLDFFETVWKVIESPKKAFHDITLAEHKNYSLLLFALFGVALSFTGFWYFRLGTRFDSLLDLLGKAAGIGIIVGFASAVLFTLFFEMMIKLFGGKGTVRNSLGLLAYATTPVALSLVMILPIELLTFGMFLFTSNPDPSTIKPGMYVTLIAFDALMALWAVMLGIMGASVGKQVSYGKAVISVVVSTAGSLGVLFMVARYLVRTL